MSDLSSYRNQVTQYGQRATEAENAKRYEEAYNHYMAALDVFMHLIKCKSTISQKSRKKSDRLQRVNNFELVANLPLFPY